MAMCRGRMSYVPAREAGMTNVFSSRRMEMAGRLSKILTGKALTSSKMAYSLFYTRPRARVNPAPEFFPRALELSPVLHRLIS